LKVNAIEKFADNDHVLGRAVFSSMLRRKFEVFPQDGFRYGDFPKMCAADRRIMKGSELTLSWVLCARGGAYEVY